MSNRPLLLGVTGGIGSGKSTVCRLFAVLGIPVYHADDRAKWLITHDVEIKEQIQSFFGQESFVHGQYNNAFIASQVFQSPNKLKQLNAIIHPAVGKDFEEWVRSNQYNAPYLVKEAALMFDTPGEKEMDQIAVVHAPDTLRIKRVQARDPQRSVEQINSIIANQVSQEAMMKRGQFLIDNSDNCLLIPQILLVNSSILAMN
ncbi:MAG TPA: dephospho-CoA kinase [Cytophagaceae bacterium]|jgi:dephospho-CoA kinase|nr:dephospho-CoA kinase [Cytophagaceae bacterium]